MDIYYYFQLIFDFLNTEDHHVIIMAVYLCLLLLPLVLRVITCFTYRSALFAFHLSNKELKTRDEIAKIRSGLLRKIAADYIRIADKSITRIPTVSVVEKHIAGLSLLGWRFVSIMPFVEAMESGLLWVGLILSVVFSEYAIMYGVLAAAGFLLIRITTGFFDFRTAKNLLCDELLLYTEREIGHFYAADSGGAILRLKSELAAAINKQSETLKAAIGQISAALSEAMEKKLLNMNETTLKAARDWENALTDAGRIQAQMNATTEHMQTAGAHLQSASGLLASHLQEHAGAVNTQLNALVSAVDALKESNAAFSAEQEAFLRQAKYIERNQAALEMAMQAFEETLQNVTRSLGDGLGAYLKLHAQTAAQTVSDTLSVHMERMMTNHQETFIQLQSLFDQLRDQSKDISANLRSMHEKLEVRSHG